MERGIKEISDVVISAIREQWVLAGHSMTRSFEESLRYEVKQEGIITQLKFYGKAYGVYLSRGVPASGIPYTPGGGRGGTSKYITGIKNWVQMKLGISDQREALGIAFAIAKKHSERGMPIRDGQLGSRFLLKVQQQHKKEIGEAVKKYFDLRIQQTIKHGNNDK
jgi:hypothetical protein